MTKNLTQGSPLKLIVSFAVPIMLGNMLQQLYSTIDAIIVGQFVGINAFAGVGATDSLHYLVIGLVIGCCTGFGIPIAQSFGAGNMKDLRIYFTNAIVIVSVLSVVITSFTIIYIDDILTLMNTNEEVYEYARTYIVTIFVGITGMMVYDILSATLRAIGDTKTPLYLLIFSSVLNIILDLLFILVFNMGIFGAAFATVLSRTLAGIICAFIVFKKVAILKPRKGEWKLRTRYVKRLVFMGVPMGLECSITATGLVILQSAINTLDVIYLGAFVAGQKISYFASSCVFEPLGLAIATFVGQNLGAKKLDRIKQGIIKTLILGCACAMCLCLVFSFTGQYILLLFVKPEETLLIEYAMYFLVVNSASYVVGVFLHVFRNAVQGSGYSSVALFAGVMELIARCIAAFVLIKYFGYTGVVFAETLAWLSAVAFLVPTFIIIYKILKKRLYIKGVV